MKSVLLNKADNSEITSRRHTIMRLAVLLATASVAVLAYQMDQTNYRSNPNYNPNYDPNARIQQPGG